MSTPNSNSAIMTPPVSRSTSDLKVTSETPWLGLRSFTEDVRDYFFGRDREIQELHERVLHRPLTVLFGQSGLGKTSLLRAGLIPGLREAGYLPILIRLVHDTDAEPLEHQAFRDIARVISSLQRSPTSFPSLWELFHDPAFGFAGSQKAQSLRPVRIFDQFEEIFTLGEAKRPIDARAFLESLACLVENRPPARIRQALEQDDALADRLLLSAQPCKILLSLRDDFLHRLERWRRQMPSMMDNRLELRLLSGPQALRAVYEPGAKRNAIPIVSSETAHGIVRFVAKVPADTPLEDIENVPPLLSLICEQLNARRLAQHQETIQSEALERTAPEVLSEFYTDSFAPYPPALRDFIESKLISESGFRESVTLDTAIADLRRAGISDPETALRGLVDQRMLIIEERGGISRVEFTHDILAPIAFASRVERKERAAREEAERNLAEQRRKARQRAMLTAVMVLLTLAASVSSFFAWRKADDARTNAATAEQERGKAEKERDRADLEAKTARLAAAEAAQSRDEARQQKLEAEKGRADAVDAEDRAVRSVERANKADQQSRTLLQRASRADFANGRTAWQEDFDAQRKGERAESVSGTPKWHEAVAHFVRALELNPGNRMAAVWLHSTLLHRCHDKYDLDMTILTLQHESGITSANFSPDGTKIITANSDNTAQVWNAVTGLPLGELLRHDEGDVIGASLSPDGSKVVTVSKDRTARIWDSATGQPLGKPLRHDAYVNSESFSPDGLKVVTASSDNTARIWDVASGQPRGDVLKHNGAVTSVSFSSDGSLIVTSSDDQTARIWDADTGHPHGEPLRHEIPVSSAIFNHNRSKIVTTTKNALGQYVNGTGYQIARVWDVATPDQYQTIAKVSPAVLAWAGAIAGVRINDDNNMPELVPLEERQLARAAPEMPPGSWAQLEQWLKTRGANRTLSPTSTRTLREVAEGLRSPSACR